jgi:hypothetical protein
MRLTSLRRPILRCQDVLVFCLYEHRNTEVMTALQNNRVYKVLLLREQNKNVKLSLCRPVHFHRDPRVWGSHNFSKIGTRLSSLSNGRLYPQGKEGNVPGIHFC